MHDPIIILNFLQYRTLTLHLYHPSKTFDHFPFDCCDGPNKMAWPVLDGSGGMIVNDDGKGVRIYCKVLRLTADVGDLMWR